MLKKIMITCLFAILIGFGTSVYAANFEYSLDIELLPGYDLLPDANKIGGFDFIITGGAFTTELGDAIPTGGNWTQLALGRYGVFDDYMDFANLTDIAPVMSSGNLIKLFSDTRLTISDLQFIDYLGTFPYPENDTSFSTTGFTETAVPLPPAILLLGGGLVGLVGLRRRKISL